MTTAAAPAPAAAKPAVKPLSEMSQAEVLQRFERVKERLAGMQERQRILKRDLDTKTAELEEAKAAARTDFGTDDIAALEKMLQENHEANVADVVATEAMLDEIERELQQISQAARPAAA